MRTLPRTRRTGAGTGASARAAVAAGTLLVLQASFVTLLPEPAAAADRPARLDHDQAVKRLERAGLSWTSSGGCADRRNPRCTSFDALRAVSLRKVIKLKRRSGCPITLTGGTEAGHEHGRYSHYTGYKLDIALSGCVDRYITRRYPFHGLRDDGARLYRAQGALYARTPDHWDILLR
ncbi:hypothetical protein [Planobispora takensis]|uniref:Uncharacterized protein n=1 Tax=Planobispora takensis TaxID=1367882 RepID=A0A8J3SPB2_9ACTN|nr:hypothetical protein [Planobispora takensis]GIH98123.1 hypothetical protein Pta02_01320 [Planobispora takensis]